MNKTVNVPMRNTMKEYVNLAAQTTEGQKEYFTEPFGNNVSQCSPMPVSVQAHHSFVDGIHIEKFVDKLQKYLNEL